MPDREKVKKGLECCTKGDTCFSDCPYFKEVNSDDNRCWLYSGCPCRTGACYGLPDDGCPVYRWFRKLIEEREGHGRLKDEDKSMTVNDAMREFRKTKDAIDTLDRYINGEMPNIAGQHVDEIREVLEHYMDMIAKLKIAE